MILLAEITISSGWCKNNSKIEENVIYKKKEKKRKKELKSIKLAAL